MNVHSPNMSAVELSKQFADLYAAKHADLTSRLTAAPASTSSEFTPFLDAVHRDAVALEKQVNEAAGLYLPSYDQAKYMTGLRTMFARIEAARSSARATKKFAFKSRAKLGTTASVVASAAASAAATATPAASSASAAAATAAADADPSTVVVRDLPAGTSRVVSIATPSADVHVRGLTSRSAVAVVTSNDSDVTLRAAHISSITNSAVIIAATIDGSVLVDGLRDSVLVLAGCRQLRVHHAHNVVIAVRAVADPIIEDCDGVVVVPFAETPKVPGIQVIAAHPDRAACVKDFHWLVADAPSPHWRLAREDEGMQAVVMRAVDAVLANRESVSDEVVAALLALPAQSS
ncbi:hypothetical protein H9P43_004506 [Blastocladiella emersonii ATCC 22665]|nr:hypothetical protein H9P43_004506 [Blastocladiella emersonii ATCC 22665]